MSPWQQFIDEITDPERGWLIVVSTLACLCFVVVTASQFIKCLKTKNTTSLSVFFATILPITNTLITIYDLIFFAIGLNNGNFVWGLLLPAVINGLISAYGVMILKIKHVRAAKKLGLTEEKYYQKYLKPKSWEMRKKRNHK
ncbi:MAG: hypothetical protein KBS35_01120 [Mycoplasma sp.]|nr:hypothetical protein [Candidatus Hennigella equi]